VTTFGFCLPIFAGVGDAHVRTPLLERVEMDELAASVVAAEELGYDSVWVADHLILGDQGAILEGWTLLAALAGMTSRIRLGPIHLAQRFRHPAILAKMVATLDFISKGRFEFFYDPYSGERPEASAYGLAAEDEDETVARFEESIRLIYTMWREENPTFQGRYYNLDGAVCKPRPVQQPAIPLWLGTGGGPRPDERPLVRKMLPLIARYADWYNTTPVTTDALARVLNLLQTVCAQEGRDYATLGKSLETQILVAESPAHLAELQAKISARNPQRYSDWAPLMEQFIIGDVPAVIRRLEEYTRLGIDCFMLWFMDYPAHDGLQRFAEQVMPHFRVNEPSPEGMAERRTE
jgi:alkanesulfonate monooxygenase SsuD/methylene tetrahydromethanopterin reductase-like flavin-dependent oxidoreductase (luciferase family)